MATQRYISTSFWTDKWIRKLDPSERYVYLYLLTNPETNIAGVYDITIDRMAFDTGYDERTLLPILDRFAAAGKAYFIDDEWVVIPAWPKHQRVKERDNNRKGIDKILRELPTDVFERLGSMGYEYRYLKEIERPLQAPSKPLARESNYSDTDSDTDTDTDVRSTPAKNATTEWADDVIDYLNKKAGKRYRHTETNRRLVNARLREGFTTDDCRTVIDNQSAAWKDDAKMNEYLRPATLFAPSKFEGYLNRKSGSKRDEDYIDNGDGTWTYAGQL